MNITVLQKKKTSKKKLKTHKFGNNVDRIFIGNRPTPPKPDQEVYEEPLNDTTPPGEFEIDKQEGSITYKGKTFEKGDNAKWSPRKSGKLVKIGKRKVIILREDNHKERRLKLNEFINLNF